MNKEQIIEMVRNAGVVGAGGGGFPTYVKLSASANTVIANGSECEPLLNTDKTFISLQATLVLEGLKIVMQAVGASDGVVAIKEGYPEVLAALEKEIGNYPNIKICLLQNYYPAGDEQLLVYDVTGRIIPEGGIPLNVEVVVCNVVTLAQIYHAISGKPVTERILTVTGEVAEPMVCSAPVGTTYRKLIEKAGGVTTDDFVVLDGGPMMGNIVSDLDSGIAKTTSGIIVLPVNHLVIGQKQKTTAQMIKLSKSACCQCFRCTDLCPRNLLGHEIYPHMTMRTIDYNLDKPTKFITSAFLCSQCGMCEMVACDSMRLSPKKIFAEYKKLLMAAGVKNPHRQQPTEVNSAYNSRKTSGAMLLKKLGIAQYYRTIPYMGQLETELVRIPVRGNILVTLGDKVQMGEVIAQTPREQMGTDTHASLPGTISNISDTMVEIRKS